MQVACVALAATLSVSASAVEPSRKLVAFNADARIELDAEGKLLRVQAAADLPDAVRTYIEQRVARWKFAPPKRGDAIAPAATYLTLGACAIPTETGYRMGLDLKDTGPRPLRAGGWANLDTRGMASAASRTEFTGPILMQYIVDKDGNARMESIDIKDPRVRKAFSSIMQKAIADMRFAPEEFAGQPVATRQTLAFDVRLSSGSVAKLQAERIAEIARSPECVAAATDAAGPSVVTVDSVVRVLDVL